MDETLLRAPEHDSEVLYGLTDFSPKKNKKKKPS